MDQNGIAWMNWSIADLEESSGALHPGASGNGGWNAGQLSASGTWVRNQLRSMDGKTVGVRLARLGSSSIRHEMGVFRGDADLASAEGYFVHVCVDAATAPSVPGRTAANLTAAAMANDGAADAGTADGSPATDRAP